MKEISPTDLEMMRRVAVALVEPLYEVNVGQSARVSVNFGVKEFILVKPKVDLEAARKFASHGVGLLEKTKILSFNDLKKRFDYLVGTTAITSRRSTNILRSSVTPEVLKTHLQKFNGSICIIFGRDTTGLRNEELKVCDMVVNIPTGASYPTLNVAHAVAIILYELSKTKTTQFEKMASRRERERVVRYAVELANISSFPQFRIPLLQEAVKKLLNKSYPTHRETTLLMGLIRKAVLAVQKEKQLNP